MVRIPLLVALALAVVPYGSAQTPPGQTQGAPPGQTQNPPAGQAPPGQGQSPRGTQQTAPVPKPDERPVPVPQGQPGQPVPGVQQPGATGTQQPGAAGALQAGTTGAPVDITLENALQRARQYSQQVFSANIMARLAHEDTVQARAAMLPTATGFSQFIYTQPNGTPSGVFVSNDGPHVYNDQVIVHGEIWNPQRRAEYRRAIAAEAVARARADLATRGLIATIVQNYYGLVIAQRKLANAQQSLREVEQLVDITQKQEAGGEVAHADVIKAQIQLQQRQRDLADAQLNLEKARLSLGILIFPNFGQTYNVTDDLATAPPLPPFSEIQRLAAINNPDIRVAQSTVQQQTHALASARSGLLPTLSFDYFFGINANQFALHNPEGNNLLGSVAQAQLNVPIWNWGALRSKVRQAELQLQQARGELTFAQRTLLTEEQSFYIEALAANTALASLRSSLNLSAESLRLTLERYRAGEATILEVVDAQTTLTQARNAYDDGVARYRLALANPQTLTGAF
jgi:outer membrane protein